MEGAEGRAQEAKNKNMQKGEQNRRSRGSAHAVIPRRGEKPPTAAVCAPTAGILLLYN